MQWAGPFNIGKYTSGLNTIFIFLISHIHPLSKVADVKSRCDDTHVDKSINKYQSVKTPGTKETLCVIPLSARTVWSK